MTSFEETWSLLPGNGWLDRDEAELLWNAVKLEDDVLEAGVYWGRSAVLLAHRLAEGSGKFWLCDPFIDGHHFDTLAEGAVAWQCVLATVEDILPAERLCLVPCSESDLHVLAAGTLRPGLVYLDADHSYEATSAALARWSPLAGAVAAHDYAGTGGGAEVKRAVDELPGWRIKQRASRMVVLERHA